MVPFFNSTMVRLKGGNFNEIRKGETNELFVIVKNGMTEVAVIRINKENGCYIVEKASVMRKAYVNRKELLWQRERTLLT